MRADTARLQLFGELIELPGPVRAARLTQLSATQPALAAEMRALLESHEHSMELQLGSLLRDGLLGWIAMPTELSAGERIGPYRVEREIGRGGMGVVYLARRDDDTIDVQVAIKLTARRTDLLDLVRHEARLLSGLSHPHIARFIDVGRTADGTLYLITEFVPGQSLQARLLAGPVSEAELQRWASQLSAALSYAHARQTCHGDLKPANVIIDNNGDARLLDFGIGVTLLQEQGQAFAMGLTPEFAAPEVINDGLFTIAAEIYSLGQLLRCIVERVALRAGARADWQALLSRACGAEPSQRYESMNALARDLARIGSVEVLQAREHEAAHRLQRGLRRYWLPLGLLAVLVIGTVVGLLAVLDQRNSLQEALNESERSRTTADRTLGFVLDALAAASSEGANKVDVTVREFADATGRDLAPLWRSDPDTAGQIVLNLAKVDHGQERYQRVIERVDEALQHPMSAPTETRLRIQKVDALRELSRLDEAWAQLDDPTWPAQTRDDWRVNQTRARLLRTSGKPVEAEAITRQTLASATDISEEEHIALAGEMVTYVGDQGRLVEALQALELQRQLLAPVVQIRPNVSARNAQNRALILHWMGRSREARVALQEAVDIYRERLAPMHSSHADVAMIGVEIDKALGDNASAQGRIDTALAIYRQQLGVHHPKVAEVLHTQGNLALQRGDLEAAAQAYQASLDITTELPAKRAAAGTTRYSLCGVEFAQQRFEQALTLCRQSLIDLEASVAEPSHQLSNSLANLGRVESELGQHEQAVLHLGRAVEQGAQVFDAQSMDLANIRLYLSLALARDGQMEQSRAAFALSDRQFAQMDLTQISRLHARSYIEHGLALAQAWNDPAMLARFQALANAGLPGP
ncbi:MAG: serine/threonine protein kinase [Xanthomonadales bacterium]|nr:serine/threonine protein kinase [Xanthomonadales bacterium]